MEFFKKLSTHIKMMIIGVGGAIFIMALLLLSCTGSVDYGVQELERRATESSKAYYILWGDGTTQEIVDFSCSEMSIARPTKMFSLVAKEKNTFCELWLGYENVSTDVKVSVVAMGLPKIDEETEENETEDKELITFTITAGSDDATLSSAIEVLIPKDLVVVITFSKQVSIDYIAVNFKDLKIEE